MTKLLFLLLLIFSFNAQAYINEVECSGNHQTKEITLEIERPFPSGSSMRNAMLAIVEDGELQTHRYHVFVPFGRSTNRLTYNGAGLRLEVDLWPDSSPRWGRTYRSTVTSSEIGRKTVPLNCRFPWAD
jgi:hypothetical protein